MNPIGQIKVTTGLLNCRSLPSTDARVIKTIKRGEVYDIFARQDDWGQLEDGSWINLKFTENTTKTIIHEVQARESLWEIAEIYYGKGNGARYLEIKQFNNLKSDIIYSGMKLKIP